MTRGPSELTGPVLSQLGLAGLPVVTGSPARYAEYNVRVMPFAIFVDAAARVRASSLVNHDWQMRKLSQIAAIPLDADRGPRAGSGREAAGRAASWSPADPGPAAALGAAAGNGGLSR
jgi:hypothetical protein